MLSAVPSHSRPSSFGIRRVHVCEGIGGHWINDQIAVQRGAVQDGLFFEGAPSSAEFDAIRTPSVAYSLMFELDDGSIALGDCSTVANLGHAGRPKPLKSGDVERIRALVAPVFEGRTFDGFISADAAFAAAHGDSPDLRPIAYGVSQAALAAAAATRGLTMAETLRTEYDIRDTFEAPGFAGSCGWEWHVNADKAIARRVEMFPQAAIQTREQCERLPEYCRWIIERLAKVAPSSYRPDLHFDFHAALGRMVDNNLDAVVEYIADLANTAKGYRLYLEDPMLAHTAQEARDNFSRLRRALDAASIDCALVADEWANAPGEMEGFCTQGGAAAIQIKVPDNGSLVHAISAVRLCRAHDVLAYLGGSCNETDISARATAHVGLAFGAWRLFTKPGLGFDEGLMILRNELSRTLTLITARDDARRR